MPVLPKLKSFFPFYGAKFRIGPLYPPPIYRTIIEPFAGSAGYSTRYFYKKVELYDTDPYICGTWDYLIRVSGDEILRLPLMFDNVRDLQIPQEAQWLIGWWLKPGNNYPYYKPSKRILEKMRAIPGSEERKACGTSYWNASVRNRLSKQCQAIRHWKIYNRSFTWCPSVYCTWFVDPPYQDKGKAYRYNKINYDILGRWCQRRNGQVIVCENVGATWLPFEHFLDHHSYKGADRPGISQEAVWTQGC